jgi:methylaspartate ammonia-lyase
MKIKDVFFVVGRSGHFHYDMAALRAGPEPNGFVYRGQPKTAGFTKIIQPAQVISILVRLDDGQVAFGDCADVIFTGAAGRDALFNPSDHLDLLETEIAPLLRGREVANFRSLAADFEQLRPQGRRLHTAVRYGLSQALLHGTALARRRTMAEVIAGEYGTAIATAPIPMLASCDRDDDKQLDRMILKRADLLPHIYFTDVERHLGRKGEKLLDYAKHVIDRISEIGDSDYRPTIHLDTYGTIGELFRNDVDAIAGYLCDVAGSVHPFELLIESPIIAATKAQQIQIYAELKTRIRKSENKLRIIVDEWCNTLEDIRDFADAGAGDLVQVKTPDLGGIQNSVEAVLYCRSRGMGTSLGGTANETEHSAQVTAHVGLACQPSFLLAKPGLGGDEALMIQGNEMARALRLVQGRH